MFSPSDLGAGMLNSEIGIREKQLKVQLPEPQHGNWPKLFLSWLLAIDNKIVTVHNAFQGKSLWMTTVTMPSMNQ